MKRHTHSDAMGRALTQLLFRLAQNVNADIELKREFDVRKPKM